MSAVGRRIDRYVIEAELDSGGFGTVYRARHTVIGRVVRPVILASLQRGRLEDAWRLYRKSLWMHVRAMRIRFLVATAVFLFFAFARDATKLFSGARAA